MKDGVETTVSFSAPPQERELVVCWDDRVARIELTGSSLVIGRGESCDVRILHPSVSRAHAKLDVATGAIEDLGSANGLVVDGLPLRAARLEPGVVVEVGTARLVLRTKGRGATSPMTEVQKLLDKAAPTQVSLILIGETGVGKEILAESIHARSRREHPLVRLNCAGLTATLLESELFGYERGAFTGAVQAKPGLLETADKGTLFLDELGEMPEPTQAKLLRVIESREVRRVGAVKARHIDVRFVSATHEDLRTLASMGRFREDLLFRLNGLTVRVPPLRERRDEIAGLTDTFLREACARANRPPPRISDGARALLEAYRWPGNVRELRNVIDRAVLLVDGDLIEVGHIVLDPPRAPPSAPPSTSAPPSERARLVAELMGAGGNQALAAKALGMTPRQLAYRMDKLGIPRPRRQ